MAQAEEGHWWYRGLRDVVTRSLAHPDLALPERPRVLDAGCGTGANLALLEQLLRPAYLGGFDLAPRAVEIARLRAPRADVYRGDIREPSLHVAELDLLVSLDVIYVPGVERSRSGLRTLVAALRPGGLFMVNLPAYSWLSSEHDVAIHTSERFTAGRVRSLLVDLGLSVIRLSYRLCLLLPAVALWRLPRRLAGRAAPAAARSDLHRVPGRTANRLLFRLVQIESPWIAAGYRLPWGSSVFAVGRKP